MFLSPEELAGELLQDGRPRCAEDEEGESRCLPTVFFIGVSKCGERFLRGSVAGVLACFGLICGLCLEIYS